MASVENWKTFVHFKVRHSSFIVWIEMLYKASSSKVLDSVNQVHDNELIDCWFEKKGEK